MYVLNAHYIFALTTHCAETQGFGGRFSLLPANIGGGGGGGGGRVF